MIPFQFLQKLRLLWIWLLSQKALVSQLCYSHLVFLQIFCPLPVSSIGEASGVSCSCPEPSGSKQDCAAHSGGLRSVPERWFRRTPLELGLLEMDYQAAHGSLWPLMAPWWCQFINVCVCSCVHVCSVGCLWGGSSALCCPCFFFSLC